MQRRSLGELDDILQSVIGGEFEHLHGFRIGHDNYGELDPGFPSGTKNERNVPLDKIASEGSTFIYDYDFGNGWAKSSMRRHLIWRPSTAY